MSPLSRKRIVVLSAFYDPYLSGAERMVKEVVERLCGRFDFTIVTARLDRKLPAREERKIGQSAYVIDRVGFGFKGDKWLYPLLAPLRTLRLSHDLVHAVMESYAGIALWWYRAFGGKQPSVLTLQSGDLDMPEKNRKIPRFVWRNIHVSPTIVVGISTALADRAKALGAKDVRVIPNGVDFAHLAKIVQGEKNRHRAVTVARLSSEKGLSFLIEAMPGLFEKIPDAELVIVGGGALENELKEQTKRLGIADRVSFRGAKPNDEAMAEVAKSGVFILPSLGEGLGIVLLEAQALGVPVVATRVGGIPDVIEDGKTGLLIPPKDPAAIAEALARVMTDPVLAARLAGEASKHLERFDWDRIAEQYAVIVTQAAA